MGSSCSFNLKMFDMVRIDHFRGLESFWAVPGGEKTAVKGHWIHAHGDALLGILKSHQGELPIVAEDLAKQISKGSKAVSGVMIESNLFEGNQKKPEQYGVSITDACISWETTETVLSTLAKAISNRRQ